MIVVVKVTLAEVQKRRPDWSKGECARFFACNRGIFEEALKNTAKQVLYDMTMWEDK